MLNYHLTQIFELEKKIRWHEKQIKKIKNDQQKHQPKNTTENK